MNSNRTKQDKHRYWVKSLFIISVVLLFYLCCSCRLCQHARISTRIHSPITRLKKTRLCHLRNALSLLVRAQLYLIKELFCLVFYICLCIYIEVEFNKICDALKQVLNLSQLTYLTLATFNILISATRYSAISDEKMFCYRTN